MSSNGVNFAISLGSATHNRTTDADFMSVIADIANGRWRQEVEAIRAAYATNQEAGDELKRRLPAILWSGTFTKRAADALKQHSGLVHVDLDKLGDKLEAWREHIWADPHTLHCMTSPSGTGLKVVYRCDPARPHIDSFRAAEFHVLQAFGLVADPACKDVNRLCFVTYDPEAFFNQDAIPLPYPPPPVEHVESVPEKSVRRTYALGRISPGDDYDQRGDWKGVLTKHRWTPVGGIDWRRPDKTIGISARWDSTPNHPERLYVWSSNAPPFKVGGLYKPWHIYALLECGGDFDRAADELYNLNYGSRKIARPDADEQARIDAENEESYLGNGHSDVISGEQWEGIAAGAKRHAAATETPIKDPGGTAVVPWPEPISAATLCATPPPTPDELIAGVLYAPGTMLLSGPSKTHKTFTLLDQAVAIANGGQWLGHQCRKTPSLYLNLELQDFAIADRVAKICSARGIPVPPDLHIWNLRGLQVTATELQARLTAKIAQCGAKVVVIDPHYKISSVSGFEESSNDDQGKLLSIMECLCHNSGAALILSHHFAKGDASAKNAQDRASGAGTFTRWPDAFVTFTPHDDETAMTIDFFLRNFAPIKHFVAVWQYPRWQLAPSLDPAKLKRAANRGSFTEKHTTADLLATLGNQLLTASEWEKASGMAHTTFHRKRRELLDAGKVTFEACCYKRVVA